MVSIQERATVLITAGVDVAQAYQAAAAAFEAEATASHQAEHAKQLAEQRGQLVQQLAESQAKSDQASKIRLFLGFRVANFPETYKIPGSYSISLETGAAIEAGNLGVMTGKSGKQKGKTFPCYFAPKLWVFGTDSEPFFLAQKECKSLHAVIGKLGAEEFAAVVAAIGSPEAIANHAAEKETKELAEMSVNRKAYTA